MGEAVFNLQEQYVTTTCFECGVAVAMPWSFQHQRRIDKAIFYCLNGHGQAYCQSEADKVRKQLSEELERHRKEAEWQRRLRERAERERKKVERKLRRVERGVCPHCNRSFENLRRHVETKHVDPSPARKE